MSGHHAPMRSFRRACSRHQSAVAHTDKAFTKIHSFAANDQRGRVMDPYPVPDHVLNRPVWEVYAGLIFCKSTPSRAQAA
jgi:hypothetical protein